MKIKQKLVLMAGKAIFNTKKHSPEILVATGIVAATGGVILACKATLKVNDALVEYDNKIEKIKSDIVYANRNVDNEDDWQPVPYPQEEVDRDVVIAKVTTGLGIARLYIPAATLFIGGIVCILSGHNILRKRNTALIAAYKVVEEGFAAYRRRVIEDQGEEKDREYRMGIRSEEFVETDEHGVTTTRTANIYGPTERSMYARVFCKESTTQWTHDSQYNLVFLKHKQAMLNDLLLTRGHVLLNEVYDILGFDRTTAGSVVGWVLKRGGDNYIDFNIYEPLNMPFVNGFESSVWLDFNVDGVVYDKIDESYDKHYGKPPILTPVEKLI